MNKHPDRTECMKYLDDYRTPKHVVGHCKSVAAVACKLGNALNNVGGTRAAAFDKIRFEAYHLASDRTRFVVDKISIDSEKKKCRFFDIELIRAAGLLHDMARVEERHWDVCADFCKRKGFFEEENIIRVHMHYEFTMDAFHLTEADIVSLADRLSLEDHYAGLDARMDYIIRKAEKQGNYSAREIILKKKAETKKLMNQIESRIDMSIDDLMKDIDYENG